jgi:hypothetical protein
MVLTRDGLKPIEQIRDGDVVWSRSEHNVDEAAWRPVVAWRLTGEQEIYDVHVSTSDGRSDTFRTTEMHPFWVEKGGDEGTGGFVAAGYLDRGDQLRLADGSAAYVTSVEATGVIEPVYNFSVEGWHTYHVGELGVWVHNECVDRLIRVARENLSPVARSQLDAIGEVANQARAELMSDPRRLRSLLSPDEVASLERDPSRLRTLFGTAVHRRADDIVRSRARTNSDTLAGVTVRGNRPGADYVATDGARLDITTRRLGSVENHLVSRGSQIDAVATYEPVSRSEHRAIIRALFPRRR